MQFGKLARSSLVMKRSAIDWWYVGRSSLGVAVCLIAGLAWGSPLDALAAGIGAISVGFVSLRGFYRTRVAAMFATAAGMAATAYLAGIAGPSNAATVIVTAAAAYAYGIFSSLGESAAAIGLNSMIAMVIISNIALPGPQRWIVPLCVFAGGLVQTLLVVVLWPIGRHATERRALAVAYRDLAAYARRLRDGATSFPTHQSLVTVRATLADPQPFVRHAELVALQTLADEAERIRATLASLATTAEKDAAELSEAAAEILELIAQSLERARSPQDAQAWWGRVNAALDAHPAWQRLFGQLRGAWRAASLDAPADRRITAAVDQSLVPHVQRWWPVLRANLSFASPFGRHAARLAIALGAAMLIYRTTALPRGYWVALTALFVLRPDFTTTFTLGLARIGGTLGGALLASLLALIAPRTPSADVALGIAFATLGYLTFSVNYALYTITITAYVVFMFSLAGIGETGAIVDRVAATLGGGLLAMLVYRAWPTWESPLTREQLAELLEFLRDYAVAVLDAYAGVAPVDSARLEAIQTQVWKARTSVDASIEHLLGEPAGARDITPQQALAIVTSTQRIGLANLALQSACSAGVRNPIPGLQAFARALDAAMRATAQSVRSGKPPQPYPSLRDAYAELARALGSSPDRDAATILAQCDLFVDSVNTIAEVLGSKGES